MSKARLVYLYIAIACFTGIILIFVFDGYMGRVRTLEIDNGRYTQVFDEQWMQEQSNQWTPSFNAQPDDTITFTYTLENRVFSDIDEDFRVYLKDEPDTIFVEDVISAGAFGTDSITWTIETNDLLPPSYTAGNEFNFEFVISAGEEELELNIMIFAQVTMAKVTMEVQ